MTKIAGGATGPLLLAEPVEVPLRRAQRRAPQVLRDRSHVDVAGVELDELGAVVLHVVPPRGGELPVRLLRRHGLRVERGDGRADEVGVAAGRAPGDAGGLTAVDHLVLPDAVDPVLHLAVDHKLRGADGADRALDLPVVGAAVGDGETGAGSQGDGVGAGRAIADAVDAGVAARADVAALAAVVDVASEVDASAVADGVGQEAPAGEVRLDTSVGRDGREALEGAHPVVAAHGAADAAPAAEVGDRHVGGRDRDAAVVDARRAGAALASARVTEVGGRSEGAGAVGLADGAGPALPAAVFGAVQAAVGRAVAGAERGEEGEGGDAGVTGQCGHGLSPCCGIYADATCAGCFLG